MLEATEGPSDNYRCPGGLGALCVRDTEIGMHICEAVAGVLGNRYRRTLAHFTKSAEGAVTVPELWANV